MDYMSYMSSSVIALSKLPAPSSASRCNKFRDTVYQQPAPSTPPHKTVLALLVVSEASAPPPVSSDSAVNERGEIHVSICMMAVCVATYGVQVTLTQTRAKMTDVCTGCMVGQCRCCKRACCCNPCALAAKFDSELVLPRPTLTRSRVQLCWSSSIERQASVG